jgi:hypothetical protein
VFSGMEGTMTRRISSLVRAARVGSAVKAIPCRTRLPPIPFGPGFVEGAVAAIGLGPVPGFERVFGEGRVVKSGVEPLLRASRIYRRCKEKKRGGTRALTHLQGFPPESIYPSQAFG